MVNILSLFFFLLPFQFALNPGEGIDLALSRLGAVTLGGLFLLERLRSGSVYLPRARELFFMMGFFLIATLSFFWAKEPAWTSRKLMFLFSFLPLWFVLADIFWRRGVSAVEKIASGYFLGAVISAVIALLQFLSQFIFSLDRVLSFWFNRVSPFFLGETFSASIALYPSLLVNIGGKTILRAVGVFPDPHVASFYFGMALPFGVWFGIRASGWRRTLFLLGTGVLFFVDLLTFSRGGYLGLLGMVFFCGAFFSVRYREKFSSRLLKGGAVVIVIFLVTCLALAPIRNRMADIFSVTEGSNAARIVLWREAVSNIGERPLLGYGLGNYPLQVKPSAAYREPIYIHDIYLDIWAELGVIGLIFFLAVFLYPAGLYFVRGNPQTFAFPAVSALALFLGHSFFENTLFSVHIFPVLLFLIAMLAWYNKES